MSVKFICGLKLNVEESNGSPYFGSGKYFHMYPNAFFSLPIQHCDIWVLALLLFVIPLAINHS
jgi:hypothetical protein